MLSNELSARALEREAAECLKRLSLLEPIGSFRRFVVARMGSTGSSWLAKLLNSHPDVYCSQEGVCAQVFPATQTTELDIVRFLEHLAWDTKHYAYQAVGDVGSAWASQLASLPFVTALLVRHPARVLSTRVAVYPDDQSFTALDPGIPAAVLERWGIDVNAQAPIDRIFLQDCFIYDSQLRCTGPDVRIIRIEDLQNVRRCREALLYLTGLRYGSELIEPAIGMLVNPRSTGTSPIQAILESFSPRQREWYELLLPDAARQLGYDLQRETRR